jgi:glycogen synthase
VKILVVSNLYPPNTIGGYEIQCAQAVADLRRRGHDVVVLTSVPRRVIPGDRDSSVLRTLRTPDVYSGERAALRNPFWEFESNLLDVENVHLLLDVLRRWEPDVCYLWNLVAIGGVGIVATLQHLGVPWVWHLGDSVPSMLSHFDGGALHDLGREMAKRFDGRFLACSRTVVDSIERLVSIEGRTRVVPNWVTDSAPVIERDYFAGGRDLRIVYVGRLVEEKGIFLVLDMAAALLQSGETRFRLDVIGTGMDDEVAARVDALGIGGHTRVLGWLPQDEVKRHLAESDVMAFPTHGAEPFGLVPLEAASLGCMPIIPPVAGISEWLVDGVHCLKAARNADAFAATVRRIVDREIDLTDLAPRAARAVHDGFAIDAVMPIVESELVVAAESGHIDTTKSDEAYRIALIADALLRRHVVDRTQH